MTHIHDGDVIVLQVQHFARVLDDGAGIGRKEELRLGACYQGELQQRMCDKLKSLATEKGTKQSSVTGTKQPSVKETKLNRKDIAPRSSMTFSQLGVRWMLWCRCVCHVRSGCQRGGKRQNWSENWLYLAARARRGRGRVDHDGDAGLATLLCTHADQQRRAATRGNGLQ